MFGTKARGARRKPDINDILAQMSAGLGGGPQGSAPVPAHGVRDPRESAGLGRSAATAIIDQPPKAAPQLPAPSQPKRGGLFGNNKPNPAQAMDDAMAANNGPLGSAMRNGFDYDALRKDLAGNQKKPHWLAYGLAALGDGFARHGGRQGYALQMLMDRDNERRDRAQNADALIARMKHGDYARQHEADLRAANPFTIGRDRVQFDPRTGQSNVLYDGAEDYELYASRLGHQEGSPQYNQAVEDYVLRSSGPSAHGRDMELDDHRTSNDRDLENLRYGNRRNMEELRQGNRSELISQRGASRPVSSRGSRSGGGDIPTINSPAEASRLPPGTKFRTPDGRIKVAR